MPSRPTSTNSRTQRLVLDGSDLVLTVVEEAAHLAPTPLLRDAARLALGVTHVIQGAKSNQDAFRGLANDGCGLVYAILCHSLTPANHTSNAIPTDLLGILRQLLDTLASVEQFARREVSKDIVMRFITHKDNLQKIQEFRETLRYNLHLLGLQSNITIQEHLATIASRNREILEAIREHNMRVEHAQSDPTASEERSASAHELSGRVAEDSRVLSDAESIAHSLPSRRSPPQFSDIQSSQGTFAMTYFGGNQNTVDTSHHITNTNSGNTTTTVTMNSNNDSSAARASGRSSRHLRRGH